MIVENIGYINKSNWKDKIVYYNRVDGYGGLIKLYHVHLYENKNGDLVIVFDSYLNLRTKIENNPKLYHVDQSKLEWKVEEGKKVTNGEMKKRIGTFVIQDFEKIFEFGNNFISYEIC